MNFTSFKQYDLYNEALDRYTPFPVLSTLSGATRILIGTSEVILGVAGTIFNALGCLFSRKEKYKINLNFSAAHIGFGILSVAKGVFEAIPGVNLIVASATQLLPIVIGYSTKRMDLVDFIHPYSRQVFKHYYHNPNPEGMKWIVHKYTQYHNWYENLRATNLNNYQQRYQKWQQAYYDYYGVFPN